jgi:hypothetical protein
MFPKTGNSFPNSARHGNGRPGYAHAIALALKNDLGETHQAVKTLMRWTGANERTVKHWLAGTHGPSGEHLMTLVRHSDPVLKVFLALTGRECVIANLRLLDVRAQLSDFLKLLDLVVDETKQPT